MFLYDAEHDLKDGEPWSEMDIADLKNCIIARGNSLAATASFLCRAGSHDDVARKAAELGLTFP